MVKNNFLKFTLSAVLIIFLIFSIYFILNVLGHSFCFADDYAIVFNTEQNILKEPLRGLYFSSTLDRIFAYVIPSSLNIHPSDFKSFYFRYIETIIILFSAYGFSIIINKEKNLNSFLLCFLFSLTFILFQLKNYIFLWLFTYEGLFRMFLQTFLFMFLFYLINKQKLSLSNKIILVILCLICTTSNEMIAVTITLGLIIYQTLNFKFKQNNKLKDNLPYLLTSIFGITILLVTGVFLRQTDNFSLNIDYLYNLLLIFPEFLKEYMNFIFLKHWVELFILIVSITFLIKKNFEENKNKITLIISFLISIWIFFFLLIGLGKTYYLPNKFWIIHPDLHYIYSFIMYAFILNLVISYTKDKKYLNTIINTLFLLLIIFFSYRNFVFYNDIIESQINPQRVETYKAEKIIRLANLKNKDAIISNKIYEFPFSWELHNFECREKYLYKESHFFDFQNQFRKKIDVGYYFDSEEVVEKEFKNNGGTFSEEELKNIKFSNLLNDEFLLNK